MRPVADRTAPSAAAAGAASLLSLLWLGAALYLVIPLDAGALRVPEFGAIAAGIAAPIAVVWLIAMALARGPRREAEPFPLEAGLTAAQAQLAQLKAELEATEARAATLRRTVTDGCADLGQAMSGAETRASAVAAALSSETERLRAVVAQVDEAGERGMTHVRALQAALPAAHTAAEHVFDYLEANVAVAQERVTAVETLVATAWARQQDAASQADELCRSLRILLTGLEDGANSSLGAIARYVDAIEHGLDQALERAATVFSTTGANMDAHADRLHASLERGRALLDELGGEAARVVAKRLERLVQLSDALAQSFDDQDQRSRRLAESIEQNLVALDSRAAETARSMDEAIQRLTTETNVLIGRAAALAGPLDHAIEAAGSARARLANVHAAAEDSCAILADRLPTAIEASSQSLVQLSTGVVAAGEDVARVIGLVNALAEPVDHAREQIELAAGALEAQRIATEQSSADIVVRLETALQLLADVTRAAEEDALTASRQLIDSLSRLREVGQAAAASVRETMAEAVDDTREAVLAAAGEATREAFAAPVEAELASVRAAAAEGAAAAGQAVEQLSRQLLRLGELAGLMRAQSAAVEERLSARLGADLGQEAEALIATLQEAAVPIGRALDAEAPDRAWLAYYRGEDRRLFARRAVRLLGRQDRQRLHALIADDPGFRDAVDHYVAEFERLLTAVGRGGDHEALTSVLLSSDLGKLYLALGRARG